MSSWAEILQRINEISSDPGMMTGPGAFFRGHSDSTWDLTPGLGRLILERDTESRLYYRFLSYGGHLIPARSSTWDVQFLMQHHGLPTRLLDWSESLAVALYFALRGATSQAAIWILSPYWLNHMMLGRMEIERLDSAFPSGYEEYFINDRSSSYGRFPAPVIAVSGGSDSSRMRSQRAVFTLHGDLERPLNQSVKNVAWKVLIPKKAFEDAKRFLNNAGVNEFSLFPDLDGLGRHLRDVELSTLPKAKVEGHYEPPPTLWTSESDESPNKSMNRTRN
jgi:hypothetical protein